MNLDFPAKLYRTIHIVSLFFFSSPYKTSLAEWSFQDCSRGTAEHKTVAQYHPLFLPSAFLCLQEFDCFSYKITRGNIILSSQLNIFRKSYEHSQKYSKLGLKTYFFKIGFNIISRLDWQRLSVSSRVPQASFVSPMLATSAAHFILLYLFTPKIMQKLFVKDNLHIYAQPHTMYNVSQVKQCILTTYNVLLSHSCIKLTCQDSLFSPTQVFRQQKKDIHLCLQWK